MVDVAPLLGLYLARPPTPPRESSGKLSSDTAFLNGVSTTYALLDTPDESPASSAEYFRASSGKARKKVGFSGWTQYHKSSPIGGKGYDSDEQRRRLPPSRECNPTKSILKPYVDTSSVDSKENVLFDQTSLPSMLRSAALHLASDSRSAKVDAYTSLLGCLSAYDDVPDAHELAEKMGEISVAMRRDTCAKNGDGTLDSQLATQALKLVTVLLCTKGTANLLPEDFCSFIFEQSIVCLEDPNSPKMLVSHYMHLVEKQKFSPRVLTTERLNRLISVLSTITIRVKGNRVVCHRLNIYQRLVTQARPLMISRVGNWIDSLISGMLSTIKDIRARAIAFGTEAGLQLGTTTSVSQECINVFNRQSPEGTKVAKFLETRLTEMTKTKEDGLHVPQIWSVVVLFLRSRPQQIERWEHLRTWLTILQKCFNSSDAQIKFQANIAWNRFIFALDISTATSTSMARVLKQPIVTQLERKSSERNAKLAKQIARSSYCTLLYYALRPSATHAQLDQYWDTFVVEMLPKAFSGSQGEVDYACEILAALFFNHSQPRIWEANKANTNGPMKPDDLPTLDSKWVRSKTESILGVFGKLFELSDWQNLKDAPVILAWRSFMSALGNASSKEIKVSMGTITAVANIVSTLKSFLSQSNNLKIFDILLEDAVAKIGHIPFNEKRILLTQSNAFEAAAETPSSRGSSNSTSLNSAAIHLISLLLATGEGLEPSPQAIALGNVVRVTLQNAASRQSRLKILRNLAQHLPTGVVPGRSQAVVLFWTILSSEMRAALRMPRTSDKHNDSPDYPGHEYRDVVKVLELGLHLHSQSLATSWTDLYDCLCETLGKEVGNVGVLLIVQGPLADVMHVEVLKRCDDTLVELATSLLRDVRRPINAKIIEHAQMQLWGVMPMQQKSDPMELLEPIQLLIHGLLDALYASADSISDQIICAAISSATSVIRALPTDSRQKFVEEIQYGPALWFEDEEGILDGRGRLHTVINHVQQMYETVKTSLESGPTFDSILLARFEHLLISCLNSRHKSILNQSILMWNHSFGAATTLEYPKDLQNILLKLRDLTDIQLPSFSDIGDSQAASSPLQFVESQDSEDEALQLQIATPEKRLLEPRSSRFSTPSRRLATASPNSASNTGEANRPQSARRDLKTTPKTKLRHENSQIQFAAIESSPMAEDSVEMLTDRQKEVKERQQHEAALFLDIRSSPRLDPVAAAYRLPTLAFNPHDATARLHEEETSPSFPPDAMMNDFLGSSPTPSSSRKRSEEPYSDDGPPSSPPIISSRLQVMALPSHNNATFEKQEPMELPDNDNDHLAHAEPVLPPSIVASDETRHAPRIQADDMLTRERTRDFDTNLMSDLDVYVDAPTEPSEELPSALHDEADVVEDSFHSQGSVRASAEDDQVTAQLMSEIAKASSQRSSPQPSGVQETAKVIKKRKAGSADTPKKRWKGLPPDGDSKPRHSSGATVADCVLISARPPSSSNPGIGHVVEGERSAPPPPVGTVIEVRDETPIAGNMSERSANDRQEMEKAARASRSVRRRVQVKIEQDDDRRSGRITRTSSRLSHIAHSSPHTEFSFAPQEHADSDPLPWTDGPKGSRWAYVPATTPTIRTRKALEPAVVPDNNDLESVRSQGDEVICPATTTSHAAEGGEGAEGAEEAKRAEGQEGGEEAAPGAEEAASAEAAGNTPVAKGLVQGFQNMLENVKKVTLRPEEERTLVALLFESVQQVHEAGRRHRTN